MPADTEDRIQEINSKKVTCGHQLEGVVKRLKDPKPQFYQNMRTAEYWEKLQTHIKTPAALPVSTRAPLWSLQNVISNASPISETSTISSSP